MLFNSYIFILLFLPLTLAGWYLLNLTKNKLLPKVFLLGMSLWFYAYFNIKYLPIIILSIAVNYSLYLLFGKISRRKLRGLLLAVGLLLNIGVLFYYKYLGFFTENLNALFGSDLTVIKLVLPLGISFFTFQQVSFVVDSYKSKVPQYSFLDYALFVTFFPQLIAGPIVLHSEIIPQFADKQKKHFNFENFSKGITAFTLGISKKVLIADTFGSLANLGFGSISQLNSTNAILSMLAYTLQIYFDFSGYCDMATGLGLMFNINIPQNFNSPYRALDMDDFWKRWHMTLTRFLRENVYFPLGGSHKGKVRTYINIFIVFLASGIWHGANWTFFFWGIINGIAVIISKLLAKKTQFFKRHVKVIMWLLTFAFINLAWIYFRADSMALANEMIAKIFAFDFGAVNPEFYEVFQTSEFALIPWALGKFSEGASEIFVHAFMYAFFAFAVFASVKMKNTNERISEFKPTIPRCIIISVLFVWSVISLSGVSTFLYFNF